MDKQLFLYDTEGLHRLCSDELVKQGLRYFTDNRVIGVGVKDGSLEAQVEDENGEQYWLRSYEADERLEVDCDCRSTNGMCVHAVAALYAYADQYAPIESGSLNSALDEAIQERIKKGRNEVKVKLISGNPGFGTWQASSLVSASHWQRSYQVHIRSLD